jgi:hypothetical protein
MTTSTTPNRECPAPLRSDQNCTFVKQLAMVELQGEEPQVVRQIPSGPCNFGHSRNVR